MATRAVQSEDHLVEDPVKHGGKTIKLLQDFVDESTVVEDEISLKACRYVASCCRFPQ